jgi:hypothetical protein
MEMIASILEVCLEGTKKTHIMYRANVSNEPLNSYLELLLESGMLEKTDVYRTTVRSRMWDSPAELALEMFEPAGKQFSTTYLKRMHEKGAF